MDEALRREMRRIYNLCAVPGEPVQLSHTTGQGPIEVPPVPDSEVTPEDDSLIGKRPKPKRKPKKAGK